MVYVAHAKFPERMHHAKIIAFCTCKRISLHIVSEMEGAGELKIKIERDGSKEGYTRLANDYNLAIG